jgi:flagellar motor switch protein FliN/FliY
VDILVNGSLLATGEVVVVDDHFAVRITKLLNRVERLKKVL